MICTRGTQSVFRRVLVNNKVLCKPCAAIRSADKTIRGGYAEANPGRIPHDMLIFERLQSRSHRPTARPAAGLCVLQDCFPAVCIRSTSPATMRPEIRPWSWRGCGSPGAEERAG